jgi:hypothetical protein
MIIAKFLAPEGYEWRFEDNPHHGAVWHLGRVLDFEDPWSENYVTLRRLGRDFAPMWTVTEEMLRDTVDPASVIRTILEEVTGVKRKNSRA